MPRSGLLERGVSMYSRPQRAGCIRQSQVQMQPFVPQEHAQLPLLTLELPQQLWQWRQPQPESTPPTEPQLWQPQPELVPPTEPLSQQGLQQELPTKSGKMMPLMLEEQELQAIGSPPKKYRGGLSLHDILCARG